MNGRRRWLAAAVVAVLTLLGPAVTACEPPRINPCPALCR
jgi:hypothetical protein